MQIIAPDQPNEIPATPKQGEIIVRPSTEADSAAMIAITARIRPWLCADLEREDAAKPAPQGE